MVKTLLKLSLFCLALAIMSTVALAQPINQLGNPGFEQPAAGKITDGFLEMYPWADAGTTYIDSGVEPTGAYDGTYRAYEDSGDSGAYQVTDYQMNLGDQITLSWWALASSTPVATNPPVQDVGLISDVNNPGAMDPFSATTPLAVTTNALSGGWVQYTINYTAQAADVGNYVGCYFYTTNNSAAGGATNSYGGYDDFYLGVLPAGSLPSITIEPANQTAYKGAIATFTVSAVGATSYQWMEGVTGSGVYTNLINGGQFDGVTTPSLTITNLTLTNNGDYVVVVANASGSVTSAPPANLTVASIIYQENFGLPFKANTSVTNVGWMNDISGNFGGRLFTGNGGFTYPIEGVYSFDGSAATEAFYATTASANGGPYDNGTVTNKMAFPGINLQNVQNLSFAVNLNSQYNGSSTRSYIAVQLNFGNWYVSINELLPRPTSTLVTHSMNFNPNASAWNNLTVSGTGSDSMNLIPVVGSAATANLTGYITGIGLVCVHTGGSTVNFNDYTVLGAIPPTAKPVISSPPTSQTNYTGTTVAFSVSANTNGSTAGLTYQWEDGTVGSGVYSPLSNSGQFSGATSSTLTVSNITSAANHKDYVVVVTDGAGSVTSTPPATLTVQDSIPLVTAATVIYPNDAPLFGSTNVTIDAGNNNTLNLTASFIGSLPISYQWQVSPNPDGSGAVNIPNATNSTLTLPNPQTNASAYYTLTAINSQLAIPTNSGWAQLTVLPAINSYFQWSAPVAIDGLTAAQILNGTPGTFVEAESFSAPAAVTVTNDGTLFLFDNTSAAASQNITGTGFTGVYTGPSTGDTNLDTVLNFDVEVGSTVVTLNNLTVSNLYSAQLISLNDIAGTTRQENWSDPNNAADVSPSFQMGDNVYVVGTFTATNTTETINENAAFGNGYISAVIVRQVPLTPTLGIQWVGSNLQVSYTNGILLQATSLTGPWTTNNTASPYTFTPTGASMFFRTQAP